MLVTEAEGPCIFDFRLRSWVLKVLLGKKFAIFLVGFFVSLLNFVSYVV